MTRSFILLIALAAAVPVSAAPAPDRPTAHPSCEPFTDPRELRFRPPAATISGHIAAGSVAEPGSETPEAGQQLVFGSAELIDDATGTRRRVNYAYWNTTGGCGGWEPARGARYTFDLADDKAPDNSLRVMRYVTELGARR